MSEGYQHYLDKARDETMKKRITPYKPSKNSGCDFRCLNARGPECGWFRLGECLKMKKDGA